MKSILEKCTKEDFIFISGILDSYFSFTDDKRRKELLQLCDTCATSKSELIELMDKQIRYYGSSDIAYLKRALLDDDSGIAAIELVKDVCEILEIKINTKKGASLESLLEAIVFSFVEKKLTSMSPKEVSDFLQICGLDEKRNELILDSIKKRGIFYILPILWKVLGAELCTEFVVLIATNCLAKIVGAKLSEQLVQKLPLKNFVISAPVVWVVSGTVLAYELQGPAYRKTIPVCLYLGIVALRDGVEEQK